MARVKLSEVANSGMLPKERSSNKLQKGESRRSNGTFCFRWSDELGKRRAIYAPTLAELRIKEDEVLRRKLDGLRTITNMTINDLYELWCDTKVAIKDNTLQNYKYMYNTYVRSEFGRIKVMQLRKFDVKKFYNNLIDYDNLRVNTIGTIQNVLHQVLQMAVDDGYIRNNPFHNALKELTLARGTNVPRSKALTKAEQERVLSYTRNHPEYFRWYPILAVLLNTGMRIGECTGLRWRDIDLEKGIIDINHTLVYYSHGTNNAPSGKKCAYEINSTKTPSSVRTIPMMDVVREAFILQKENMEKLGFECKASIAGYTDFIFLNRFGDPLNNSTVNKALRRIVRDCNDEAFLESNDPDIIIPMFSCHSMRHTFATRMVEEGVNLKVVQATLGHADATTTLNIYAKCTEDLKKKEFNLLSQKLSSEVEN